MRKFVIIAVLFFMTNSHLISQVKKMEKLQNKLEELRSEYAPDSRVALFEFTIDQDKKIVNIKTDKAEAAKKLSLFQGSISGYKINLELLPSEDLGNNVYGIINLSVANLRKEPKHAAELVSQALLGTPVKVLEKSGDWYRIQTPDNYISWTDDDALVLMDFQRYDEWKLSPKVIFTKEYGFAFESPDGNSKHVSDLVIGNILKLVKADGQFYQIEYPDGRVGYIPNEDCADYSKWIKKVETNPAEILNTAYKFIGLPYLWGGTSSKGFDCSGFTKTVYFLNGIMLPRDASQQVLTGETVDTKNGFENLQPGDLLFFGRKAEKDNPEKVTHVAIYIGNMEYIHASGKVKINSLDPKAKNFSEYRLNSFIRAQRILNSINNNGIETVEINQFFGE